MKRGEIVQGKDPENGWTEINCYGYKGYVYSSYLKKNDNSRNSGNMKYLGKYQIYGYDGCRQCSPNGITASGSVPVAGRTVAMANLPFGTRIYISGIGYRTVEDRGVAAGVIDVFVNNHDEAYKITSLRDIYIVY